MIQQLPDNYKFNSDQEKLIESIGLLRFRRRQWEVLKTNGKTPHDRETALKTLLSLNKEEALLMGRLEKSITESLQEVKVEEKTEEVTK